MKFNGQDITESQQLIDAINSAQIGQTVTIVYWHGSAQKTVSIALIETPKPQ